MKKRIDFIAGGIQKCGTTALYRLLRQHPRLIGSSHKEPHFFSKHNGSQLTEEEIEGYHSAWLKKGDRFASDKLYFEASPDSCFLRGRFDPLPLVKLYNPEIKIIILFRDPVERFYSEWSMLHRAYEAGKRWGTDISFRAFLDSSMRRWNAIGYEKHLYHGCYASIALRLAKLFDKNLLLFLNTVDVHDSLAEIERFLRVEPFDYQRIGASPAKYHSEQLPNDCARELRRFYEPEVRSLSALTGLDVSWWLDGRS